MLQKASFLLVVATCSGLTQLAGARDMTDQGEFDLQINERGTRFTQRVKVATQNTVTFQVPSHNDVDQSDVLLDYEQRLSVTRIPRLKECHVEDMPADESSPQKVLMDIAKLKLIYRGKPRSIRTIERTLIKIDKFKTSSPTVTKFCRSYSIFKMAVIHTSDSTKKPEEILVLKPGHRIQKRRSGSGGYLQKMATYLATVKGEDESTPDDEDGDNNDYEDDVGSSSSGHYSYIAAAQSEVLGGHCKPVSEYDLDDCIESPQEKWNFTRVENSHTCTYRVKCSTGQKIKGKWVPGECNEEHQGSREICYDLACNTGV